MVRLRILLPLAALLLSGCSRVWLPEGLENRIGESVTESVLRDMRVRSDPAWQKYIDSLGRKIASVSDRPAYHYRFYIVESSTVNAFAVPDGSVFVTTELLKFMGRDRAALAGVLAHEIGHIARRHSAETLQAEFGYKVLSFVIFGFGESALKQAGDVTSHVIGLGYGREMELEADLCAVRYLLQLGYKEDSALKFLKALLPLHTAHAELGVEKYLRTHPPTPERIKYSEDYLVSIKAGRG